MQSSRLWSAPASDIWPGQNSQNHQHQHASNGYHGSPNSTSRDREQPPWRSEATAVSTRTDSHPRQRATVEPAAVQSDAAGMRTQQGCNPPFATVQYAPYNGQASMNSPTPQRMPAAVAVTPMHAAGRQSRTSISPPFATVEDSSQAGTGQAEQSSREVSPPYATNQESLPGASADSSGKHTQARLILEGSRAHETVQQMHSASQPASTGYGASLYGAASAAARAGGEILGVDAESGGIAGHEGSSRAESPRQRVGGSRPYATEASLQVCSPLLRSNMHSKLLLPAALAAT